MGRKTKAGDVWDYDYTAYALSNTAEPVKGIYNLTSDEKDYINGETVTLTMDITQNTAGDDVEYQLLYSTNGKSFKPINKEYEELSIVGSTGVITIPELPLVKKDTIYYLKGSGTHHRQNRERARRLCDDAGRVQDRASGRSGRSRCHRCG